jgi:hypothetical protein
MTKIAGFGSISQRHGSADPDPPQNDMEPQHWKNDIIVRYLQKGISRKTCWPLEVQ